MISNIDDAIEFYQHTLGLKCLNRYGDHYAEMQAPDMLIAMHKTSSKVKKGNNMSIGFRVTDFDNTLELSGSLKTSNNIIINE